MPVDNNGGFIDRRLMVNGYQLAAKEWNSGGHHKVIACHGWLDNAASFNRLAPLLPNCHIIALDMPGHGLSDHKSLQASYNIWDDLADILAVADVMQWPHFKLLGHSRGAIMSLLMSAAMPERVECALMMDAVWPDTVSINDTATQLGDHLKANSNLRQKKLPEYDTVEQALISRCKAGSMSEETAWPIVKRGLKKVGNKYQWRSDPRLTMPSSFKFTAQHNRAITDAVTIPVLVLLAQQGLGARFDLQEKLSGLSQLRCKMLGGSHHFHMESKIVDKIAVLVSDFFDCPY